MAGVPNDIPGIGSTQQKPKANPAFDATAHATLTSEDYYVFSRVDGDSSLHDIILSTGLGTRKTIAILTKLRGVGAFVLAGDAERSDRSRGRPAAADVAISRVGGRDSSARHPTARAQMRKRAPTAAGAPATGDDSDDGGDIAPFELSPHEAAAMDEVTDLSERERRRVIGFLRKVEAGDYFALLGVAMDADRKVLKRAYFRVSKEFHPDRYYAKNTGSFGPWLARIFETASKAFEALADETQRARHIAQLTGKPAVARAPASQSPAEHAKQLFDLGCASEVQGDMEAALKYLAAAIRVDPHARYLRRAAEAAARAKRFDIAEEYAKRAMTMKPEDPSYARVLANVYYAAGNFEAAEDAIVQALLMKTENDLLAVELEQDLDRVRRALVGV